MYCCVAAEARVWCTSTWATHLAIVVICHTPCLVGRRCENDVLSLPRMLVVYRVGFVDGAMQSSVT